MKNFEYYEKEIREVGYDFALLKRKMKKCKEVHCDNCDLGIHNNNANIPCCEYRIKWLYEEHIDKPTLTQAERKFVKVCTFEYYTRDKDGDLMVHESKPHQNEITEEWFGDGDSLIIDEAFDVKFDFITWESGKCWTKAELLELEVSD